MDEEELENLENYSKYFFESIQKNKVNRALKKTNSNLGINNNKLLLSLSKSFNDTIIEVKEIKKYMIKDEKR